MKIQPEGFETYPIWIVIITNLANLSIYASGSYLLWQINPLLTALFIVYLIYLESSVYREGCACCYYYGKLCAFGRGKIAKLFLKKGDPKKFTEKTVSLKDFLPSSLANIIPLVAGIYLLIQDVNWFILLLAIWPLIILFLGNPIIFGQCACPNCKQARLGCPVSKFFMERTKKGG